MMRRFNRLLVLFYVLSDAMLGVCAFALAYLLRFHGPIAQVIPPVKGVPPFKWYIYMLPFVAALVPIAYHVQGLYRLRRGRTRPGLRAFRRFPRLSLTRRRFGLRTHRPPTYSTSHS